MASRPGRAALSRARLTSPSPTPKQLIRDRAKEAGFDAVGFASPELAGEARDHLGEFLALGLYGDMGWLANRAEQRARPAALWPGVKSVIALGVNYGPAGDALALAGGGDRGAVSVYARGRDYHDVLKKRLRVLAGWIHREFDCEVKLFVDTAPVMEKPLAARAGLGWQGKHTNLVSRDFGSWLFLGEIYTALEIEPDVGAADRCGACRRCLDVCPTGAITAPYRLDARRCVSYLTIEHKEPIPADLRAGIGNRIYGCDDCLAVCPWNKFATPTTEAALRPRPALDAPRLADLAALDDASFREFFAGSPVKRTGRDRFVRNVLIAIGNSGDAQLIPAAERLLDDDAPLVRAMAVWALSRLLKKDRFDGLRERHLAREHDADVLREWEEP